MRLTIALAHSDNSREAIPVRALPFITGWNLSPDMIANALSQTDEARRMKGVLSFRRTANTITPVAAVDWEHVKVAMDGLNDKLPHSASGYADWRRESIKLLPASVFVWLNELETAFRCDFSSSNWIPDCRGEYPALNFEPMPPEGMAPVIFEGFSKRHGPDRDELPRLF